MVGEINDNKNIDVKFNNLPICIESNNRELEDKLVKIANSITKSVHLVNSEQREKLHIAAVFASFSSYSFFTAILNCLPRSS